MKKNNELDIPEHYAAMKLRERNISDEQFTQLEGYAAEIFTALGLDLHTPSTEDTPKRFIKAMFDITEGYDGVHTRRRKESVLGLSD